MANFKTHLNAGVFVSSVAASYILSRGLASTQEVIALWCLGLLGSILPDIDADQSNAIRLIFNILGLTSALFCAVAIHPHMSLTGLWGVCLIIFVIIRFIIIRLFEKLTKHRGTLHSLLACFLFGLLTIQVSIVLKNSIIFSWLAGFFIFFGMLLHLTLDECYSVNLDNISIKRSFGSALKIIDTKYPITTLFHILTSIYLWFLIPPLPPLTDAVKNQPFTFFSDKDWHVILALINDLK